MAKKRDASAKAKPRQAKNGRTDLNAETPATRVGRVAEKLGIEAPRPAEKGDVLVTASLAEHGEVYQFDMKCDATPEQKALFALTVLANLLQERMSDA